MKKFLNSLLVGLTLLVTSLQAQQSTAVISAGSNLIQVVNATNGWLITGITLTGGASNSVVSIYDNNTNLLVYTNAAYWSRGYYTTNISAIFTNNQGIVQTNIYPGIFTYSNYTAAATNNAIPAQWSGSVAANGAVTYSTSIVTTKGVVIQATGNTVTGVTISYSTPY